MTLAPISAGEPQVRILEQPASTSTALRLGCECEGLIFGVPGVSSTPDHHTCPTIQILGHTGKVFIVVSCVTKDKPYRAHPHNVVGDRCSRGVCALKTRVSPDSCLVSFSNLGIQCVKRRDIGEALRVREELRVDPFKMGYGHRDQPESIDLHAVRLCFQVFLISEHDGTLRPMKPMLSDVIHNSISTGLAKLIDQSADKSAF